MPSTDIKGKFGTIVHTSPDMIVFIYGARIKDVSSVSFNFGLNKPSNCTITIANPRDRYVITKNDLLNKWRLDKTYPAQMMYETKLRSGLIIPEDNPVFSVGDPVRIFMRGRYTNDWYIAFSGFVNYPAQSAVYGNVRTIVLSVEDVTWLLRRSFSDVNPSVSIRARKTSINKVMKQEEQTIYDNYLVELGNLVAIMDYLIRGTKLDKPKNDRIKANKEQLLPMCRSVSEIVAEYHKVSRQLEIREKAVLEMSEEIEKLKGKKDLSKKESAKKDSLFNKLKNNYNILEEKREQIYKEYKSVNRNLINLQQNILNSSDDILGTETLGGAGYFRDVYNLYQEASSPYGIYSKFITQSNLNTTRIFSGFYTYIDNKIYPIQPIIKTALNPTFTKTEINELESLPNIHTLALDSRWEKSTISPDMIIKGEVGGLWEYTCTNEYYNPRFFLIAQKELAEGETVFAGNLRKISISDHKMESKYRLAMKTVKAIDFNFNATPTGDLICEPFWDDTNPHDWHRLFTTDLINGSVGESFVLGSEEGYRKTDREESYVSFKKNRDSPFVIESKETFGKSKSVRPESIMTYVTVQGDTQDNDKIQFNFSPAIMFLQDMMKNEGLAFGWYSADGFKGKEVPPYVIESIKTFEDLKRLANKGVYFPEYDLVKLFGFNEAPPSIFRIVDSREGAESYAELLFKRYLGDAYDVSVFHAYKPEMLWWLGKSIYIRDAKVIGILNKISFTFTFGGDMRFNSSIYRVRHQQFRHSIEELPYTGQEFYNTKEEVVPYLVKAAEVVDVGIYPELNVVNTVPIGLDSNKKDPSKVKARSDMVALFGGKWFPFVNRYSCSYIIVPLNDFKSFGYESISFNALVTIVKNDKNPHRSIEEVRRKLVQANSTIFSSNEVDWNKPLKEGIVYLDGIRNQKEIYLLIEALNEQGNYCSWIKEKK